MYLNLTCVSLNLTFLFSALAVIFSSMKYLLSFCLVFLCLSSFAQPISNDSAYIRDNYLKKEVRIAMRDGVKLFTSIYIPKDTTQSYPFLLNRTPYSVAPYGEDYYSRRLGPNPLFV